jgi:hypothetical protein
MQDKTYDRYNFPSLVDKNKRYVNRAVCLPAEHNQLGVEDTQLPGSVAFLLAVGFGTLISEQRKNKWEEKIAPLNRKQTQAKKLDRGGGGGERERSDHLSFSQREKQIISRFFEQEKNGKLQPQSPPAAIGGDQDAKNTRGRKKLFKLFDDKKMNYFVSRRSREQEVIFSISLSSPATSSADIVRHYRNYTRLNTGWRAIRGICRGSRCYREIIIIHTKRGARVRLVAWQGVIKKRTGAETHSQAHSLVLFFATNLHLDG